MAIIGNIGDPTHYSSNTGEEDYFPGSPTFQYTCISVLYLCRWRKIVLITADILIDILSTLESVFLFDFNRRHGVKPADVQNQLTSLIYLWDT